MPNLSAETINAVYTTFVVTAANRTHHNARDDCHQRAFLALYRRKSTKWRDPIRLESQATNACMDAIRQEARELHFDRRVTLELLKWQDLEDRSWRRPYCETPWRHFVDYHSQANSDAAQTLLDLYDCDADIGRSESGRVYHVSADERGDDESLTSSTNLRLRIQAIKVARTMRVSGPGVRSIATRLAITHQRVPTRHDIDVEMLDNILRDLH